ncbi:hypothetical protein GH714_000153 [Hevea brasiliensis]|uniref:Uncharacterized protein n=1 Tax=Hevea brasiliensis TaxID=3981 RepID=A0A6A6NAI2_HEVBR|nr:hypothetical protein GH714_000153 [Hevea brasiliensis]
MEEITGSLGWPIVGESFSFITEFSSSPGIHSFMKKRQERYGKVFKTFFLGRFAVFMTGREASKILLTGKYRMVSLNLVYTGQQVLGLTSLLQTTGEAHKRLRRLIAEPPSLDGLKKYFNFINTLAIETLDQWPGRTVLVLEEASTVKRSIDKSNQREQEEQTLHGCKIKKGWSINLDVVSIHHDPEVFPDLQRWRTMEKDDSVQPTLERMPKNKYPIVVKSL